jgi:hypothetical protein
MILDPINAVTSIEFYKKVARQSLGRSLGYLAYLSLLFSTTVVIALKMHGQPVIQETFLWLKTGMPVITIFNGTISADSEQAVTLRHPSIDEIGVAIDTRREEPVTISMLEKDNLFAFVAKNGVYMKKGPGQLEFHDLSRAAAKPGDKPIVIDADFYEKASLLVFRIIYPATFVIVFFVFFIWKSAATGLYSVMALLINSMTKAGLEYKPLLNITLYAQTLLITLQAIFLFMPVSMPASGLLATLLTSVYLWLAIERNAAPAPQAGA